ncbi:MAG: hypothetical protein CMI58_05665 [Parcubacteria group bacterium]|nr:hypothetical protein [Parcubacteria group bacterium]|tara:strand:+ start:7694 stop:8221 length:528 start_codon:yes stop_codon:yes gene_type:complete
MEISNKVSILGTIKEFSSVDISESEINYSLVIEENDWSITIDNDLCKQLPAKLKKGGKYLLTGHLSLFEPSLLVHNVIDDHSSIAPSQLTGKGSNNGQLISVCGKIIELKFQPSRKGKSTVFARIEGISNMHLFCFPGDLVETCNNAYKKNKFITIIGVLQITKPQFDIEIYEKM